MTQSQGEAAQKVREEKDYLQNVGVKISSAQLHELRTICFHRGVNLSEYVRGIISAHLAEPSTLTLMKTALREVMAEFRKNSAPSSN